MGEKISSASVSTVKSLFGAVPYVGTALNELIFDYRSRIKQERLNHFTTLLVDFFTTHPTIDPQSLYTEDFSDLLEAVLKRVVLTKSKEKHKRLQDILVQHIKRSVEIDEAEIYLDLVNSLNEEAVIILKHHKEFDLQYSKLYTKSDSANNYLFEKEGRLQKEIRLRNEGMDNTYEQAKVEFEEAEKIAEVLEKNLKEIQIFRNASFYNLSESEFLYYKQILYAKGLLIDNGIGAIGTSAFSIMGITEFGKEFINFILAD